MAYPIYYVPAGDVIPILFASYDKDDGSSVTLTGLAVTDIEIYKDGSVTQRSSDNGYTLLDTDGIDFDSITGIHGFSIDTGDNSDASFYTVGAWFHVVVSAVTIDGVAVSFIAAAFRIMKAEGVAGVPKTDNDAWLGTALASPDTAGYPKVTIKDGTGTGEIDTTSGGVLVAAIAANAITAASIAADAITDAKVASDVTIASVTGAVGSVTGAVGSVTGAVGSVTGNVGGNVTGSVGSVAAGGITASSIAADAIGASELAADAVTEIANAVWDTDATGRQTQGTFGQAIGDPVADTNSIFKAVVTDATGATVGVDGAAILADTNELQTDWVNGGRLDLILDIIAADTTTDIPATLSTIAGYIDTEVASTLAAVDTEVAAIKAKTDSLTFTVANQVDANAIAISGDSVAADRLEALMDGIIVAQVNDAAASTTVFIADGFTEATNDHFNGRLITFISGALSGQQTAITDYVGASQTITVTALTEAPAENDFFVIH